MELGVIELNIFLLHEANFAINKMPNSIAKDGIPE